MASTPPVMTSPPTTSSQFSTPTTTPSPPRCKELSPLTVLYQTAHKMPPPVKSQIPTLNRCSGYEPAPELWHSKYATQPEALFLELFGKMALAKPTLTALFSEQKDEASKALFLFYPLFSSFLTESEVKKKESSYREIIQLFHLKTILEKKYSGSIFMEEMISPLFQKFFSTALKELSLENKRQLVRFFSLINSAEAKIFRSSFQSHFFQGEGIWESNLEVFVKSMNWIEDKIKSADLKDQINEYFNIKWNDTHAEDAINELSSYFERQFHLLDQGHEVHLPKYFLPARKLRHCFCEEKTSAIFHKRPNTELSSSNNLILNSSIRIDEQDSLIGVCHLIEWMPEIELKSSEFPFQIQPKKSTLFSHTPLKDVARAPYPFVSITKGTMPSSSTLKAFENSAYLPNLSGNALLIYIYLQKELNHHSSLICKELKEIDSHQVTNPQKWQKITDLHKSATRL